MPFNPAPRIFTCTFSAVLGQKRGAVFTAAPFLRYCRRSRPEAELPAPDQLALEVELQPELNLAGRIALPPYKAKGATGGTRIRVAESHSVEQIE